MLFRSGPDFVRIYLKWSISYTTICLGRKALSLRMTCCTILSAVCRNHVKGDGRKCTLLYIVELSILSSCTQLYLLHVFVFHFFFGPCMQFTNVRHCVFFCSSLSMH